jgi:diguanylate cyclase (GGDEF)-like protein/PAS domain S-box-containing protein
LERRTAGASRRWSYGYIAVGLCLTALFYLTAGNAASVVYDLLGGLALAGVAIGTLRNRPDTARAWWMIWLGLALTVAGDVSWTIYELVTQQDPPFPSFADALYVAGYPFLTLGLILLCWVHRPARSDILDAAIIGTGFALTSWTLFLDPYLSDNSYPWFERVVLAAYPAMDIPLVAAAALLLLTPAARSGSFVRLAVAVLLTIVGDVVYAQQLISNTYVDGGLLDSTWLIAYVMWGAAALSASPEAKRQPQAAPAGRLTIARLLFLAFGMFAGTSVWLIRHSDDDLTALVVVTASNGLLALLICVRLWDTFQAINRQEQRFRTLVEHSSDIISVYDMDGTTRYVSPALRHVLGEDPGEWIDRNAMELVHPEDARRIGLVFERLRRQPEVQRTIEVRLRRRDGAWRNVELIGTNRLADPAVRGIVSNARDITARAAAEDALRRAQALSTSVIESSSDGIFAYDLNRRVAVWNPTMERTTGMPRAQVIGKTAYEVFPFLLETGEYRILESVFDGQSGIAPAQPNRMPESGQDGFYEAYYSPMRGPAGEVIGGLCLVRNVTERTYAERALASHNRILEFSTGGAPLDVVLDETCREIERSINGARCSIMLLDPVTQRLMPASGPSLPPRYVQSLADLGGVLPGPNAGACGTSAHRRELVVCADIGTDPLWSDFRELAAAFDLRACWSIPIFDGEQRRVLGTFAVYQETPRAPTEREIRFVIEAGHLIGLAIRAHRDREAIRFQADLLDQVSAAVVASDVRGVVTHWSRHAWVLYGWEPHEAIGRKIDELIFGAMSTELKETIAQRTATGETWVGDVVAPRKDGASVATQLSLAPVTDEQGATVGLVGVAVDLSERKAFEARLAHQAFHDALTGLPNRALFAGRLDHALSMASLRGDPVGLLMIDLDRFKVINDGLGHAAGDRVLISVGQRVEACLRKTDTLARLGGDEFAILLENASYADARATADRILNALQEPLIFDGREVYAATSIGIAVSGSERSQADELMRAADMALYQAKRAGRGTLVVFDPSELDQSVDWLVLEADLRRALANNELVLHYQPVLELDTYQVVTVEALVRWQHPTRGLLPPMEFVSLAEETGLITSITDWAIGEACRQLADWRRALGERSPGHVNVNLTTRDLRDPEFVDRVMAALARAELAPSCLRLEITEQVLVDELRAAAKALGALRARGVRLAIDDFGAGASSLASLRAVEAEVLKLDRSFVRGMTDGGDDQVVVGAITAMAHALGLLVTAEGIETGEQLAAAQSAGCDFGQGYFFARPMPPRELSIWLAGEGLRNEGIADERPAVTPLTR